MNKIQETMKNGVEEFKQRLDLIEVDENIQLQHLLIRFKSHQKALLEAMLEEVRGLQPKEFKVNSPDMHRYNARKDIETIINKAIGV